MSKDEDKDEFLSYKSMIEDFNRNGVNGVKPEYTIDAEYIYDLRHETKEISDVSGKNVMEVLLGNEERKVCIVDYAKEYFDVTLNARFTITKMLEQLFEKVMEKNGMHINDYKKELGVREAGFSSGDLIYAISLLNNEDVAEGEAPNAMALNTLKDVLSSREESNEDKDGLLVEVDEDIINRILDRDFIIGI